MAKPKKSERKIKDLQVEVERSANVMGGEAVVVGGPAPTRKTIYRKINNLFRPKS